MRPTSPTEDTGAGLPGRPVGATNPLYKPRDVAPTGVPMHQRTNRVTGELLRPANVGPAPFSGPDYPSRQNTFLNGRPVDGRNPAASPAPVLRADNQRPLMPGAAPAPSTPSTRAPGTAGFTPDGGYTTPGISKPYTPLAAPVVEPSDNVFRGGPAARPSLRETTPDPVAFDNPLPAAPTSSASAFMKPIANPAVATSVLRDEGGPALPPPLAAPAGGLTRKPVPADPRVAQLAALRRIGT